jgi:hypothetical protein
MYLNLHVLWLKVVLDRSYFYALQILWNEPKDKYNWLILLFDDIVVCPLSHRSNDSTQWILKMCTLVDVFFSV